MITAPQSKRRKRLLASVGLVVVGSAGHISGQDSSSAENTTTSMLTGIEENTTIASFPLDESPSLPVLSVSAMYDLQNFGGWVEHLVKFTIHLINDHTDGWYDDVLPDAILDYTMKDSACHADDATRAYLNLTRGDNAPHVIFGCRCSGASVAVARLAAVENIPMLSPASSSVKLSNKDEFPTFSRLAAPDDSTGQVGALISLLRSFGWDRISLINTDTQFTKDIALELSSAWKGQHFGNDSFEGEVAYSSTIKLDPKTDLIDRESAIRVLNAVPVDNPSVNSRIIVLFAHHQHAFPILKIAKQLNFQPDTIWLGASEWIGRVPLDGDTSWMPPVPGYLGVVPYRNLTTPMYTDYLSRLNIYERERNIEVTTELYDYVADRIADGILALAMALSAVPPNLRRDGKRVTRALRRMRFDGVSGPLSFDEHGDLSQPLYTVKTLATAGTGWVDVGTVSTVIGTTHRIDINKICWPVAGCNPVSFPDDQYPDDPDRLPFWIWIVVAVMCLLAILFYRQRAQNKSVTTQLRRIEDELKALDSNDSAVRKRKGRLYKEIASLLGQPTPEHWTQKHGLVKVPPNIPEYWDVLAKLRETMNDSDCHLSSLSRVQNLGVWSYYVFRKNQLANKYNLDIKDAEKLHELSVWHGTSSLNPDVIYKDQQDGFMMQLSQQGQWGRGIYFSERAGYSDPYSFKPFNKYTETLQQDRELFLVKLLVGDSIFLDRNADEYMQDACKGLVAPPDNPDRPGMKFDTVSGQIEDEQNTKVYVVYENGRAYPEYLVRYYKGARDEERTPYASLEEAVEGATSKEFEEKMHPESALALDADDASVTSSGIAANAVWEFQEGDSGWVQYQSAHQLQIEQAYQRDPGGVTTIEHFPWTYAVDLSVNLQTNLDHPDKTSRKIRRIILETTMEDDDSDGISSSNDKSIAGDSRGNPGTNRSTRSTGNNSVGNSTMAAIRSNFNNFSNLGNLSHMDSIRSTFSSPDGNQSARSPMDVIRRLSGLSNADGNRSNRSNVDADRSTLNLCTTREDDNDSNRSRTKDDIHSDSRRRRMIQDDRYNNKDASCRSL